MDALSQIRATAERVVGAHGLELVDVFLTRESVGWVVRVTIDRPGPGATPDDSVGIEDCAVVSRELGTILDVEDPLDRAYTLEVTSPGLDRPLKRPQDYARFAGERVQVKTRLPLNGRRRFVGKLQQVGEVGIELDVDGELVSIAFTDIDKTRLVPNI